MNIRQAFESNQAALAELVNKAVHREEVKAREHLSLATTMQFNDNGSLTLQQVASPVCTGKVTLTRSQALYLMERIAAGVLHAQNEAVLVDGDKWPKPRTGGNWSLSQEMADFDAKGGAL